MTSTPPARRPYLAVLLSGSSADTADYEPLYREDVTLLYAASPEEARRWAEEYGRGLEGTHTNDRGERISWSLLHIVDVAPALQDMFDDDAELYSRHFRDVAAYRAFEPLLSGRQL